MVDFVIVILGVFIGIQVANWNDARVESTKDRALLVRLQADFERIVEFGERVTPQVVAQSVTTRSLLAAIRDDARIDLDESGTQQLINIALVWASFEESPAYLEVVESGTLSRISDVKLRDALNAYARAIKADNAILQRQLDIRDRGIIDRAVQFDYPPNPGTQGIQVASFDWEAMKDTLPHLQVVLQSQILRSSWNQRALDSASEALQFVKQEVALH